VGGGCVVGWGGGGGGGGGVLCGFGVGEGVYKILGNVDLRVFLASHQVPLPSKKKLLPGAYKLKLHFEKPRTAAIRTAMERHD